MDTAPILPNPHNNVKLNSTTLSSASTALERARKAVRLPNFDNIPVELRNIHQWVTWDFAMRDDGKITKKPDQRFIRSSAWLPFSEARSWVKSGASPGVGFVLTGDGLVGIDLDHCIAADGTLHEIAKDLIAIGTYTETSPSGQGLRSFIRGSIHKVGKISAKGDVPGHEIYDGRKGSARFLTVTGHRLGDATEIRQGPDAQAALDVFIAKWFPTKPQAVSEDAESGSLDLGDDQVLNLMFNAKNGEKSRRLYEGDYSGYGSQSEADLALCSKLRFFTRADANQMRRLFQRSGLMRPKWDHLRSEQTYGERTILQTLAKGGPIYVPRTRVADRSKAERLLAHEYKAWARLPLRWMKSLKGSGELTFCVLWVITSYANKHGEAFPSVETIAAHVGGSKRRVYAALAKIKARADVMTSEQRPRNSNLYRLAFKGDGSEHP
jgi:putative DNA primase/helicase